MSNPFMRYVEDFEKEAEAFLTKYECADAIENPRPIPIADIAKRLMSLDIIDSEYLSRDGSIQGAITFTDGVIEVFDWNAQEYIGYDVAFPAIFIDADIMNQGRINNTIAHECYHWWAHRNYFNFKRIHENGTEFAFRCNKRQSTRGSSITGEWTDIDKMEWQAKTIAPKILMPRKATKKKIDITYKRLLSDSPGTTKADVTALVIDSIASFFEVSNQSAAIRMLELGYPEAQSFCSDVYEIPAGAGSHSHKSTKAKTHRQPISTEKAFELYQYNDFLRATLDTGAFRFIEGYFVLNDPKYIYQDSLSLYARNNLAECTLDFAIKLQPDYLMHSDSQMMFRSDSVFKKEHSFDANTQNTELFNKAKDFEKKFKRTQAEALKPAEWMKRRMEEERWYEYTFEEKTLLDKENYSRVQKGTHNFTMRPLIAMGVGLGLDLNEMEHVLSLGGMTFNPNDREHQAYKYLFTGFYGKDIDECNDFLKKIDVKTLGTHERY